MLPSMHNRQKGEKMRIALIFLTMMVLSPAARAQDEKDRAAIEAALSNWLAAWETKDPALAARDYSADADWTNAFGMTRRGREEIEALLTEVFGLPFVMAGDTVYPPPEIRFLTETIALVRTEARREGQMTSDGESLGVRRTTHLRVFEKRKDEWLIVSHLISDARDTERPAH